MTSLREWVKPPRPLLIALCLFTGVSISALAWFGWQVLEQEKLVEAQRSRESLEQAADRLTAAIREQLADAGDRLGGPSPEAEPPSDGILLLIRDNTLSTRPANRLLFHPDESMDAEADPAQFADAEQVEFVQKQPLEALHTYEALASSPQATVRAGALIRAARVLRNLGRTDEALARYRDASAMGQTLVAGTPAGLLARHAIAELRGDSKSTADLRTTLTTGDWHLRKGQFEFYWEEANRMEKRSVEPPAAELALSNVAAQVFEQRRSHPDVRGDQTLWIGDVPYFLIWRGTPERRTVLVTHPSEFVRSDLPGGDVAWSLVDSQGRRLAGGSDGFGRAVVRTAASSQLPWTLRVAAATR